MQPSLAAPTRTTAPRSELKELLIRSAQVFVSIMITAVLGAVACSDNHRAGPDELAKAEAAQSRQEVNDHR